MIHTEYRGWKITRDSYYIFDRTIPFLRKKYKARNRNSDNWRNECSQVGRWVHPIKQRFIFLQWPPMTTNLFIMRAAECQLQQCELISASLFFRYNSTEELHCSSTPNAAKSNYFERSWRIASSAVSTFDVISNSRRNVNCKGGVT